LLKLPEIYPEPEIFKPERWFANPHPAGYYPFAGGPRVCIGQNMARAEMSAILTVLIARYDWKLAPGFTFDTELALTFKPKNGVWCDFVPRNLK